MNRRIRSICAGVVMAMGVVVGLGGCAPVAYVASVLIPPKVDALYEPPKTQPMLVMVENRANPGMLVAEADQLTAFIMDDLAAYKVAPLVERSKLEKLRDERADIDKLTISQIGREVGAEQVLYVDLQRIQVGSITGVPAHGRVEGRVHIVDVATGKVMFPRSSEAGWPVAMETSLAQDINEQDHVLIRERMLRALGLSIGRLFHDYNPEG